MNRRTFARLGALASAGAAVTAAAVLAGPASVAAAAEGEAVLLGEDNVEQAWRRGALRRRLRLYR
jgi:hypothetical protein